MNRLLKITERASSNHIQRSVAVLRGLEWLTVLVAMFVIMGVASSRVFSFDIFWQLQSGRYIVDSQSFIYQNIFSLAELASRWEHCWLHDLIFYASYMLQGYAGISLLKGLLVLLTAATLFCTAYRRCQSLTLISFIFFPLFLLTSWSWLDRPQLWTFFFFALFVLILEEYRRTDGRIVFLLIPAMVVWSNLHAGSMLGFAILLAYLVGLFLEKKSLKKITPLIITSVMLVAASWVTPYGGQLVKNFVRTPTQSYDKFDLAKNLDWKATSLASHGDFFFTVAIVCLVMLLLWRKVIVSDLLLLGGLAYMGLKLERHLPFFLFATAALLPFYVDVLWSKISCHIKGDTPRILLRWVGLAIVVIVFVAMMRPRYERYGFFNIGLDSGHYPVAAAEFVRESKLPGNLFNSYSWGGYLMWRLFPDYLVFWDGRQGVGDMFRDGIEIQHGKDGWARKLAEHNVNTVVLKPLGEETGSRFPIVDRLRFSPEWTLVFADDTALVFVRNSKVGSAWLNEHRLPDDRIDDTILAAVDYILSYKGTGAYKAVGEAANVYIFRKDYRNALKALDYYIRISPEKDLAAENYYAGLKKRFPSLAR